LVFTLERAVGGEADVDFRLEWHGRYSHSRAYVEQVLSVARLQPEIAQAELRMASGAPLAALAAPYLTGPQYFSIQPTNSLISSLRGMVCDES